MRAVIYENYGPPDVLQISDVEKPEPGRDEVLVKVFASPINYGDISARNFKNIGFSDFNMPSPLLLFAKIGFGISKPKIKILGNQFSGEIEKIGSGVTKFKPGDEVFGYTGMKMGAHADYLCIKQSGMITLKPDTMSHEEASAVPYGIMAVQLLSKLDIRPGQHVLVNGASGGIGSMAVQILKSAGARVTATCSADRIDYVRNLGADTAYDYRKSDYLDQTVEYDYIFDVLGRLKWSDAKKLLSDKGICLLASFKTGKIFQMLAAQLFSGKKLVCGFASERPEDLETLKELAESGKIRTIIDTIFSLEETPAAHEYYESKRNKGHVIISVGK